MKISYTNQTLRVFAVLFVLSFLSLITSIKTFRASASNPAAEYQKEETLSTIKPKSQNTAAVNLRPGREISSVYKSRDYSADKLTGEQNRALALASADFNADGYPDLITGYAEADGSGILTFQNGNAEAFAPQSEESFALIKEGRFPDPFVKDAETFAVPARPDFLVTGDFDRDGNLDVLTATRGGEKLYLFSGKGKDDGFNDAREINLPGQVTAVNAGEIDAADNRADLVVGLENNSDASLLVFENAETGVFATAISYQLTAPAHSIEFGKLDDDVFTDAAILTADGISILHGQNQRGIDKSPRLEKINLPFVPQALALGDLIFDRAGKTEMAMLAADGSVQIARRGELDERPFSIQEAQANRAARSGAKQLNGGETKRKTELIEEAENWIVDDKSSTKVSADRQPNDNIAPVLMKANLSGQNTDDILFLNSDTREIKILSANETENANGKIKASENQRSVYTLEAASQPTALLSMKLNNFVRPGLVILQDEKTEPTFVPSAPTANFTVTKTADTNDGACNADCSLREAITAANAAAGADTITLPAGTYTLSIANAGANEDNNATGDLDILQDLTINGAGQGTTIVQAGTTNANGIDKVFASNPLCTSVVNTSFSGITVRFGRNTQPNGAADFSFTGGGLDWCNPGAGGTLTITNATFDNNSATTGPGGGIDLDTSSTTSGSVTLTGVTISNNKSSNPASGGITVPANGGGLAALAGPYNVTITNSTITGNTAQTNTGGGLYFEHITTANSAFLLSGVTISNNSAFSQGGGVNYVGKSPGTTSFTINQSSTVSGNISGTGAAGVAQGGGLLVQPVAGTATINKTTIVNNVLSSTATTNRGGAGIAAGQGNTTVSYCRIVNNTGTTLGTGLNKDINSGMANAVENWWGCSTGPSAAPCDTAVLTPGSSGSLNYTPWIVLRHTASPSTVVVGQSTTLTASFLTDSAGTALSLSNITVLLGLPVTFNNPVRGTISGAQATIQSSGTATATFTATSAGAGSADAIVDNDVAAAGRTNRAAITITQAATTTTLSSSANPSVFGQSVTFTATVNVTAPGAGSPTGTITFKDNGVNIGACAAQTVSSNVATCTVNNLSVGNHPITAAYNGDANFVGSTSSAVTQVVNKANTTVTITSDSPDPSLIGQAYAVTVSLTVNSPGTGTPTGTITVSDGTGATCTITLPATSCNLTSTTAGTKTLTATYNGDANFNASPASAGVTHTVNALPDLTITKTHVGNFTRGQTGAQYTITVTNSGGSSTAGTVTVVDTLPSGLTATAISGTGWSCTLATLTCTRSDALAAGLSYPAIILTVNVALNAASTVTNSATVSGGGETNTANDTASDPTTVLAPTAADVTIGGRVTNAGGRGISNILITLTDSNGTSQTARTTSFGYYSFSGVEAGLTCIITASGKHFTFRQATQILSSSDNTDSINFIAVPDTGTKSGLKN